VDEGRAVTAEENRSYRVTRTRVVVETVTVHRMPSLEAAIRAVDEGIDMGTMPVNEASTTKPWTAVMLCPHCGQETLRASDGWAECTSGFLCGWTEFDDSRERARAAGLV